MVAILNTLRASAGFVAIFNGASYSEGTSLNASFYGRSCQVIPQDFAVYIKLKLTMVFLAISSAGLAEALRVARSNGSRVWCGADAISESDYLAQDGGDLSRFDSALAGECREVVEGALETIREHHPGATIWVESAGES